MSSTEIYYSESCQQCQPCIMKIEAVKSEKHFKQDQLNKRIHTHTHHTHI